MRRVSMREFLRKRKLSKRHKELINPERRLMKSYGFHGKDKKRARQAVREKAKLRSTSANIASEKGTVP